MREKQFRTVEIRTAFVCLATFLTTFQPSKGTSLMRRLRQQQGTEVGPSRGLEIDSEDWIRVPAPIQDVLMSIDDRLRSLDTFSYTLKLARLDSSLDQLSRRMENIETKLGRLETKFDIRMEKVEEVVISKDLKEEFSNEHLSRRMENLNEKINTKATYLDAKLDRKLERIMSKLELLERDLHSSADDILERLIKNDERYATFENEVLKKEKAMEELSTNVLELKLFIKDDFANVLTSKSEAVQSKLDVIQTAIYVTSNQREKALGDINSTVATTQKNVMECISKLDSMTANLYQEKQQVRENDDDNERTRVNTRQQQQHQQRLENITVIVEKGLQDGAQKLQKLDNDIELYTRKVVNGIQELWKTSDELKSDLSTTLHQSNRTRELVRQEFRKIQKQIEPLPRLEPKLLDISEVIEKKITDLGNTVDNSFATLLVAQNSFISSCRLIQEEEMHVYDILQQIAFEMRNRSAHDVNRIDNELRRHGIMIRQALSRVVASVAEVGNSTASAIDKLGEKIAKYGRCPSPTSSYLQRDEIDELCRQLCDSRPIGAARDIGDTDILDELRRKIIQALEQSSPDSNDYEPQPLIIDNQTERIREDTVSVQSDYPLDYHVPAELDYH